jgi:hypothetical protein
MKFDARNANTDIDNAIEAMSPQYQETFGRPLENQEREVSRKEGGSHKRRKILWRTPSLSYYM